MKNSCRPTLLTDFFRQLDQNQSVDGFVSLFEVHITFGFQSEVPPLFILEDKLTCLQLYPDRQNVKKNGEIRVEI